MIIQLSAGQGPLECQLAVGKLYEALKREYGDISMLSGREGGKKRLFYLYLLRDQGGFVRFGRDGFVDMQEPLSSRP